MMKCTCYTAQEMEERFGALLSKHEDVHQLILGNMSHVKKRLAKGLEIPEHTHFGAVGGEEPLWLFCNFLPYTMVVTPADPASPREEEACAAALAESLREREICIAGIQSTEAFGEAFRRAYGGRYELELSMDIMTAKEIRPLPQRGELVRASLADLEEVTEMGVAFVKDCLHKEADPGEEREEMRIRLTAADSILWLYRLHGKTAGMAASTRKLMHGRSVSFVYIRPELRRQGLCKEMMSALGRECLAEGCEYVTLYVDRTNPFSNAAYTAVGFAYGPHMSSWAVKN